MRLRPVALLLLLTPLAGCGVKDAEQEALDRMQSSFGAMGDCLGVHAAVLAGGINPLTLAMDGEGSQELVDDMRGMIDRLPVDSDAPVGPRAAFASMVDQMVAIRGKGMDAAKALSESAKYHGDAQVLGAWYQANCRKEDAASGTVQAPAAATRTP